MRLRPVRLGPLSLGPLSLGPMSNRQEAATLAVVPGETTMRHAARDTG